MSENRGGNTPFRHVLHNRADHLAHHPTQRKNPCVPLTPKNAASNLKQPPGKLDLPGYLRTLSILPSVSRWVLKRMTHNPAAQAVIPYRQRVYSTVRNYPLPSGPQLLAFSSLGSDAVSNLVVDSQTISLLVKSATPWINRTDYGEEVLGSRNYA